MNIKITKLYTRKDIREIALMKKLGVNLYLRALVNNYVVLKPHGGGMMCPVCIGGSADPIFYKTLQDAKKDYSPRTDIIMSAYRYVNMTTGLSIDN